MIHEYDSNFSSIALVHSTRPIQDRNPMIQRESAAWTNLTLRPRRQLNRNPGTNRNPLSRTNH